MWWKKKFCLFLLAKYIPVSLKSGGQKWEWRYPTACVGSYFIPDKNIQAYLICLQSCNMQKHQKANFRAAEYVCVQQWWLKVIITNVSWPITSWNTRSLPTCTRSTMRTGENTAAINSKALSMPRSEHQSCRIITENASKVQWKFCITGETSIMATTKICKTNPTKGKKSCYRNFQMYHGHLHTMTLCHVINVEFVIGCFYHCVSCSEETCIDWLSSLSASARFRPIWRLPVTQVGEIPSSYSWSFQTSII